MKNPFFLPVSPATGMEFHDVGGVKQVPTCGRIFVNVGILLSMIKNILVLITGSRGLMVNDPAFFSSLPNDIFFNWNLMYCTTADSGDFSTIFNARSRDELNEGRVRVGSSRAWMKWFEMNNDTAIASVFTMIIKVLMNERSNSSCIIYHNTIIVNNDLYDIIILLFFNSSPHFMIIIWIIVAIVAVLIIWLIMAYNRFVTFRNRVDEAWADIEVQLKRRYDLIPNLVNTVKGYAAHESSVFEKVTEARSRAMQSGGANPNHAQAENMLSGALKSLFAVAEAYPDLKANTNFLELQRELSDTENKIQSSRRFYNGNVRDYNTMIQVFPSNMIAGMFSFMKKEFFDIPDDGVESKPVEVKF